jgi:outer membrane protein assembly factor BamB
VNVAWPKEGPKKLWEYKIGVGHSSPVVAGKRLYTNNNGGPKNVAQLVCLDALTGADLWKCPFPEGAGRGDNATPAADGKTVFSVSDAGCLMAVEVDTGKMVWSRDLRKEYNITGPTPAAKTNEPPKPPEPPRMASPLVTDTAVIVMPGVAFEKATGKLLWKAERTETRTYVSPFLTSVSGASSILAYDNKELVAHDPASGTELWKLALPKNAYADPTAIGDRIFFDGSIVKFEAGKPVLDKQRVKFSAGLANPVLWEKHIYASCGGWSPPREPDKYKLVCLDTQTFAEKWSKAGTWGPLIAADGKLLIAAHTGEIVAVKASPAGFEELGRAMVYPEAAKGICWATPALADGKFYMRCNGFIACLDLNSK